MTNNVLLNLPGIWIDDSDRDWAFFVSRLLGNVVDQFNGALVACELFSQLPQLGSIPSRQSPMGDMQDRTRILFFIYAKSFVYALDSARAFLSVLSCQPRIPNEAVGAIEEFQREFGHIRSIRNSLQHIEERSQGIGPFERDIQVSVLNLGSFIDRRFGITSGDGQYVEIEVSFNTLSIIRPLIDRVIWSFPWLGPGETPVEQEGGVSA